MTSKTFKYITALLLLLALIVIPGACSNNDFVETTIIDGGTKDGYIKLEFTLPDYGLPNPAATRAMSPKAESAIDPEQLSVIVFDSNQKFLYQALVLPKSLQQNEADPKKATVTIKLAKTTEDNKIVNLVVIANHAVDVDNLEKGVTLISDFVKGLDYSMLQGANSTGKWNASSTNSTVFPMYGKVNLKDGVTENMGSIDLPMFRALARLDIGVNFNIDASAESGPYTEQAEGLEYFELIDVRVYHTHDKGYVTPLQEEFHLKPSVYPIERRKSDQPLHYELGTENRNALVREIYVPEAYAPLNQSFEPTIPNDTIHSIVIGGSFKNGKTSYYKLDFAQDGVDRKRTYMPILRNHRYLFNIMSVNSPGFDTPEEALKSTSTANLTYQLVVWDETIHEMHVNGQHYFGLDNREINFRPRLNMEPTPRTIKYQTNYPLLQGSDPLDLIWDNPESEDTPNISENFIATWNPSDHSIDIKVRNDNVTNKVITEYLHVKFRNFDLKVKVNQDFLDFTYTLDCSSVLTHGTYNWGEVLRPEDHYIELAIDASNSNMIGLKYNIYTEPINGISFSATGTFTKLREDKIKLKGQGTLTRDVPDDEIDFFSVMIRSNSSSESYCEATVTASKPLINLVTTGWDDIFGYNLTNDQPSNWVIMNKSNFGPDDDSRVKIEGFNLINSNENGKAASLYFDKPILEKWLTGKGNNGEIADIFHLPFDTYLRGDESKWVKTFLENGGVAILMPDKPGQVRTLFGALFGDNYSYTYHDFAVMPFVGHPKLQGGLSKDAWQEKLNTWKEDPILNGPFGDVTEKQWGEDASTTNGIKGLPGPGVVTVYSTLQYFNILGNIVGDSSYASIFKYEGEGYNFIFIGDGGFTSQAKDIINSPDANARPFGIDENTHFPIPRKYGSHEVYNSTFFCNALAWAIEKSRSPEMMEKKKTYKEEYLKKSR